MGKKPTYEELERRVQELEKIESEHKYSREAFRESESLFKMLYEKAPLGYQSLDENGHFIVVNKIWLDTLGYVKEEVMVSMAKKNDGKMIKNGREQRGKKDGAPSRSLARPL